MTDRLEDVAGEAITSLQGLGHAPDGDLPKLADQLEQLEAWGRSNGDSEARLLERVAWALRGIDDGRFVEIIRRIRRQPPPAALGRRQPAK